jgi:shikimate dehydrogenase
VGAGGAARAVGVGLARAGAAEVIVVNRTVDRAELAAGLVPIGRVGSPSDAAAADILVNGTSVGMGSAAGATTPLPLPLEVLRSGLHAGQVVADLVYRPVETPLLRLAAACGAIPVDGCGMLVHQAARAFEIWTGHPAPVEAMTAAMAAGLP